MSVYIIEKNVPIPATRNATYNFDELVDVDDVMTVWLKNTKKESLKQLVGSIRNAIYAYKQNHSEVDFATRTVEDTDNGPGVKVHRIK